MLDPWTALSLAAAIAQFVDFGFKIVNNVREIADDGSTLEHKHMQVLAADLSSIKDSIDAQSTAVSKQLSNEETALQKLCDECQIEAGNLLALLKKIRGTSRTKWGNFRTAVLAIWKKDEVDAFEHRLSRYREQLALRLLVLLNAKNDQQHQQITEVLSLSYFIRDAIQKETSQASVLYSPGDSGISGTKTGPAYHSALGELAVFNDKILAALFFREIRFREDGIAEAFRETFKWIFHDATATSVASGASFVQWLESGNGCYWINGKAGSGKSTLTKYIVANPNTSRALGAWAGSARLLTPAFYFWNSGTPLQKTQEGLFRSILYTVLEEHPDLIPVLFPKLVRTITLQPDQVLRITLNEVKKALEAFFALTEDNLKICLFIDGLDEYAGNHIELAELLQSTTASKNIKIVAASRPVPAYVQIFSRCPCIRLQDLTTKDIEQYVNGKLADHPLMQDMELSEPGSNKLFCDEVIDKASGVFLWVILVVRSLLEGLHNYDRSKDLMQRLHELPEDIELLYDHMISTLSATYQQEAAMILQCFIRHTETYPTLNMSAVHVYNITDTIVAEVTKMESQNLGYKETSRQVKVAEGRLRSRCCGLLETHAAIQGRVEVTALHRTVRDFLKQDTTGRRLIDLFGSSQFSIDEILLASYIASLKRIPYNDRTAEYSLCADRALTYALKLEDESDRSPNELLDEMETTMGQEFWEEDFYAFPVNNVIMPRTWLNRVAMHGLTQYLTYRIEQLDVQSGQDLKDSILIHMLIYMIENDLFFSQTTYDGTFSRACYSILTLLRTGARIDCKVKVEDPCYQIRKTDIELDRQGRIQASTLLAQIMTYRFAKGDTACPFVQCVVSIVEAAVLTTPSKDNEILEALPSFLAQLPVKYLPLHERKAMHNLRQHVKTHHIPIQSDTYSASNHLSPVPGTFYMQPDGDLSGESGLSSIGSAHTPEPGSTSGRRKRGLSRLFEKLKS